MSLPMTNTTVRMTTGTEAEAVSAAIAAALTTGGVKLQAAGTRLAGIAGRLQTRGGASKLAVPVAAAVLLLSMHPAMAQAAGGTGSIETFLQNLVNIITGKPGQLLAVLAVALSGLGAMFGAMSARTFGGVVLGTAIVFSAAWIVGQIIGGSATI